MGDARVARFLTELAGDRGDEARPAGVAFYTDFESVAASAAAAPTAVLQPITADAMLDGFGDEFLGAPSNAGVEQPAAAAVADEVYEGAVQAIQQSCPHPEQPAALSAAARVFGAGDPSACAARVAGRPNLLDFGTFFRVSGVSVRGLEGRPPNADGIVCTFTVRSAASPVTSATDGSLSAAANLPFASSSSMWTVALIELLFAPVRIKQGLAFARRSVLNFCGS